MQTSDYEGVRVERGTVARITIDRPDKLNALVMTKTDVELARALDNIERDPAAKVVILTGAGTKAFCTGWDLSAIGDSSLLQTENLVRSNLDLFLKIWNFRLPIVAAINGYALGAGASVALACDLAFAAESAKIGEPEIRHGALSPFPVLPFFTHAKPLHEFYYFGDMIDAQEMLRLGLVNRVVADGELQDAVLAYAERLAKVPTEFVQLTKRSLRASYDAMGFSNALRQHGLADALAIGANTPEQKALLDILAKDGMRAFLVARDGAFKTAPRG